jgi:hypothetical protein
MTANDFRRMALGLEGVIEASHMDHPDFRVGGRIFATLQPGLKKGMVALSPEEQARFIEEAPKMFEPVAGAWGRGGATSVLLAAADEDIVGEALTLAWQRRIALSERQKSARRRAPQARKATSKR